MVSLVNNNSSRSSDEEENHNITMSDEPIEILDDELPLANGTENDISMKDESTEEKMEVIDLDDVPSPASPSAESDKNSKESHGKSGSIKSRSSRSASINSSASVNADQGTKTAKAKAESQVKEEEKEEESEKKACSEEEEEDFLGFDSDSETMGKVESCIDQYKKVVSMNSSPGKTPNESTTEKSSSEEKSSSGESRTAENEEPGNVTPSTSAKKTPRGSKKSVGVDLSNPEFRKPFEYGWVRELVYRSTTDNTLRRNADIYYYTPTGKKVRSSREILEHLTGDLTIDNFTFFKEAIGLDDPSKEIIREAKAKPGPRGFEDALTPPAKKLTPKVKAPSTPAPKQTTPKELKVITPKVVFRGSTTPKVRPSAGKSKLEKKRKSAGPDDVDVMVESEDLSPEPPKVNTQTTESNCSIRCHLALGLIPSLQCALCLCLFHPACMGVSEEKLNKPSYIFKCKACKAKQPKVDPTKEQVPPAQSLPQKSEPSVVLPTAQIVSTHSSLPPTVPLPSTARPGIVGAVTTWLSPESSIQQGNNTPEQDNSPGIYVNSHGATFIGFSRNTVVNVNTQGHTNAPEVATVTNSSGLYLIPCDPQLQNGPQSVPLSNGIKRPLDDSSDEKDSPPEKIGRLDSKSELKENEEKAEETENTKENKESPKKKSAKTSSTSALSKGAPPQYFMMNLNAGFVTLLHAFRYLRVYELLRAAHVCKMWQFVASHAALWETVKMKNSRVSDWEGFGNTLAARCTKHLDLRKMLVPDTLEAQVVMWEELCKNIKKVKTLVSVDMGRCTPAAFVAMAEAAPQLESLVSTAIKGNEIDLAGLENCKQLKELKLKTVTGSIDIKDLSFLDKLTNLTTLALTTVKSLKGIEDHLPPTLVSLELGECCSLSKEVATRALPKLLKLRRLRLEKGQGDCPTIALLEAVSSLPRLRQLELINFDIKSGFDKALAKCTNLRILLVIPTYVTQSATTNHVVMGGVAKLSQTLGYFIWGLTLELLKVTDLFIGQVENQKAGKSGPVLPKKGTGDSIPILKPNTSDGDLKEGSPQAPSQVDILALPNLQRVLSTLLPTTRIKILKVPFSATWRQVVTDGYV